MRDGWYPGSYQPRHIEGTQRTPGGRESGGRRRRRRRGGCRGPRPAGGRTPPPPGGPETDCPLRRSTPRPLGADRRWRTGPSPGTQLQTTHLHKSGLVVWWFEQLFHSPIPSFPTSSMVKCLRPFRPPNITPLNAGSKETRKCRVFPSP